MPLVLWIFNSESLSHCLIGQASSRHARDCGWTWDINRLVEVDKWNNTLLQKARLLVVPCCHFLRYPSICSGYPPSPVKKGRSCPWSQSSRTYSRWYREWRTALLRLSVSCISLSREDTVGILLHNCEWGNDESIRETPDCLSHSITRLPTCPFLSKRCVVLFFVLFCKRRTRLSPKEELKLKRENIEQRSTKYPRQQLFPSKRKKKKRKNPRYPNLYWREETSLKLRKKGIQIVKLPPKVFGFLFRKKSLWGKKLQPKTQRKFGTNQW